MKYPGRRSFQVNLSMGFWQQGRGHGKEGEERLVSHSCNASLSLVRKSVRQNTELPSETSQEKEAGARWQLTAYSIYHITALSAV